MKCPECVQGKPGNCTGWVLLNDDEWGECATAIDQIVYEGVSPEGQLTRTEEG